MFILEKISEKKKKAPGALSYFDGAAQGQFFGELGGVNFQIAITKRKTHRVRKRTAGSERLSAEHTS